MKLSDIIINDLINKKEVDKLLYLHGLNKTTNKQKNNDKKYNIKKLFIHYRLC